MRDILFRGKRLDNGEWVYGSLLQVECEDGSIVTAIFDRKDSGGDAEIHPSTVGQYTGLLDKHGKRIFEGDIVKYTFDNPDSPNATENGKKVRIGRVFFSDWRASFSVTAGRNCSSALNNDLFNYVRNGNRVEVVGNVHETADLLEDDIDE